MSEEVVKIVIDDSDVTAAFEKMSEQFEELNETSEELSENLDNAFKPRSVNAYKTALDKNAKALQENDNQAKKADKSLTTFNKSTGRGVSLLSRFTGVGGRAARSLGGLAFAMGSTPFGSFAAAAAAATAAYSFFSDKLGANNAEIIAKNKELQDSINSLTTDLKDKFQEGKILAIDLKPISEAEKRLLKIGVVQENIGSANLKNREAIKEADILEGLIIDKAYKTETERLEIEKQIVENKLLRQSIAADIANSETKILQIQKEGKDAAKQAAEERKKAEIDVQNLFDSLIRNEQEKRILALKKEAAERDKQANEKIKGEEKLNTFLKQSAIILEQDIAQVKKEFADAELAARRALLTQFVIDEEQAAKVAAQNAFDAREIQIQEVAKTDQEKAVLQKQNLEKLNAELLEIEADFAKQRADKQLAQEQELFSIKQAAFESDVKRQTAVLETQLEIDRQQFAQESKTEEEITAFKEGQDNKRLESELNFQIARLQLIRDFNKEITKEEAAALDAQIAQLQAQLQGVGTEITSKQAQKGKGLAGLLGISEDTDSDIKAVQGALEQVTQAVSDAVAERVAALQKEVDFRNQRVEELQNDLANELKLNELGKASNIKLVQDQLAKEKAERDKAEKDKKEAAEAQFAIDTALQASNLVTSISALYSSLSGLPFGIGVALATALSAVMIGAFVASKAQASQAAGFAEGGYTGHGGKFEESKAVGERPYTYHKGEYVVPADKVKEYGLENVPVSALDNVLGEHFTDSIPSVSNLRIKNKSIATSLKSNLEHAKREQAKNIEIGIQKAFDSQNGILRETLKAIKEIPEVVPLGGSTKVTKGNNIKIYKHK